MDVVFDSRLTHTGRLIKSMPKRGLPNKAALSLSPVASIIFFIAKRAFPQTNDPPTLEEESFVCNSIDTWYI